MNRLLTGEEIDGATRHYDTRTLKAVGEWLEGECFEHPYSSGRKEEEYNRKRHRCPECRDQLKQGKMPE